MDRAVRGQRVRLDIEAGAPKILIPHSSNSTDILVINLGTLRVSNTFLPADARGTVAERETRESRDNVASMTQSIYGSLEHDWRSSDELVNSNCKVAPSDGSSTSTLSSFYSALGTPVTSTSMSGFAAASSCHQKAPTSVPLIESEYPDPANYKCLLDVMHVVLVDIDLYAAQWHNKECDTGSGTSDGTPIKLEPDVLEFPSYFVHREVRNWRIDRLVYSFHPAGAFFSKLDSV